MFKELGALTSLLGKQGKIQEEMARMQEAVGKLTATGDAGGGLVSVTVSGKLDVVGCKLSPDSLKLNDPEMLEDLIVAACNQAMGKVKEQLAAESAKMAGAIGLPPGILGGSGFPGLGG